MESDSKPPGSFNQSPSAFADFLGAIIALITLVLPLLVIIHYSPRQVTTLPSSSYSIQRLPGHQP